MIRNHKNDLVSEKIPLKYLKHNITITFFKATTENFILFSY